MRKDPPVGESRERTTDTCDRCTEYMNERNIFFDPEKA